MKTRFKNVRLEMGVRRAVARDKIRQRQPDFVRKAGVHSKSTGARRAADKRAWKSENS